MTRLFNRLSILILYLAAYGCSTAPPALHTIGIYEPGAREVVVNITDDTTPIVLALNAYERTTWKVNLKEGVKLTRVILAGYHAQQINGLPAGMPIEVYTYYPSPCPTCWQGIYSGFSAGAAYNEPDPKIEAIAGLKATSFQGGYRRSEFAIFPDMKKWSAETSKVSTQQNQDGWVSAPRAVACACTKAAVSEKCKCSAVTPGCPCLAD